MDTFKIRPALADARIHDPVTNDVLAVEGEEKPRSDFWLRCLARGDVKEVRVRVPDAEAEPAATKAPRAKRGSAPVKTKAAKAEPPPALPDAPASSTDAPLPADPSL